MDEKIEFASFKKVLIFGTGGSGKTSLVQRLKNGSFSEESPSESGNFFNYFLQYNIYRNYT